MALPTGLVDVRVCAVDDVWSALKLVIRKTNRWTTAEPHRQPEAGGRHTCRLASAIARSI